MWLWFLALHLVGLVGYNVLLRASVRMQTNQLLLAALMQTALTAPTVVALFIAPPDLATYSLPSIALIIACAILVATIHVSNVKALAHLDVSTYSILFNLRIIFVTILGTILLNEHILPLQVVGGLLIFLAVFTLRRKDGKHLPVLGVFWGVLAALSISLLNTGEKELITDLGIMHYAIPVMLLASVILWTVFFMQKQPIPSDTFRSPRIWSLIVLRALSTWGIILAFSQGAMISIANYISSLSVVILVALGVIVLRERQYLRQKIVATSLAVAGLTAILLAGQFGA